MSVALKMGKFHETKLSEISIFNAKGMVVISNFTAIPMLLLEQISKLRYYSEPHVCHV